MLDRWVEKLPRAEQIELLQSFVRGDEPQLGTRLRARAWRARHGARAGRPLAPGR